MRSRFLPGAIAAIALFLTVAGQVHAQAFPAKPVRIVTYFSAGSGPDVLIRVIADQLSKAWSQAVVVENKPGANGIIAIDALAKSEPDGYTLGVTDSAVLWRGKSADLPAIRVPAYVVADWGDQGLHTRGTIEGFRRMSSAHKWLEVHGRKKWQYYYQHESRERLRMFFDHFRKGSSYEVLEWPRVRIEVRERYYEGTMRAENEWPLARQRLVPLYLDAASQAMRAAPCADAAAARYDATTGRATFEHAFPRDTEISG
jgi:hypothetical protein